jgi:uncharacterized protein (DUF983 family)
MPAPLADQSCARDVCSAAVLSPRESVTDHSPITLGTAIHNGLACRCPCCGKGRLFESFLRLGPRCESCGLDYGFADAGDGPAIFVILFAGFVVVGCALMVEVLYQPPYWLHAVLWIPLILVVTLVPLRAVKGLLISLQYHQEAAEGRLDHGTGQ